MTAIDKKIAKLELLGIKVMRITPRIVSYNHLDSIIYILDKEDSSGTSEIEISVDSLLYMHKNMDLKLDTIILDDNGKVYFIDVETLKVSIANEKILRRIQIQQHENKIVYSCEFNSKNKYKYRLLIYGTINKRILGIYNVYSYANYLRSGVEFSFISDNEDGKQEIYDLLYTGEIVPSKYRSSRLSGRWSTRRKHKA